MSIKAMKWAYGMFEVVDLPPPERVVLLALCWDHTEAGGCYPTQERIALLSGYRRRHVNSLLKSLEAKGLIKRRNSQKAGKFQKTSYQLFGVSRRDSLCTPVHTHRVHHPAHGGRVHPSAQNRGTNTIGDFTVVDFPSQRRKKTTGGSDV